MLLDCIVVPATGTGSASCRLVGIDTVPCDVRHPAGLVMRHLGCPPPRRPTFTTTGSAAAGCGTIAPIGIPAGVPGTNTAVTIASCFKHNSHVHSSSPDIAAPGLTYLSWGHGPDAVVTLEQSANAMYSAAESIGSQGASGGYIQSGGSNTTDQLHHHLVGHWQFSTYLLSGGTLNTAGISIGGFRQAACLSSPAVPNNVGTVSLANDLFVTWNLFVSGGVLNVNRNVWLAWRAHGQLYPERWHAHGQRDLLWALPQAMRQLQLRRRQLLRWE